MQVLACSASNWQQTFKESNLSYTATRYARYLLSGFMPDPDLGCHDTPFLWVLWCFNHFHSFNSHPVAYTLYKCQSLLSSVSSSFNLSCISHNMFENVLLLICYDIYRLSILRYSFQNHFNLYMCIRPISSFFFMVSAWSSNTHSYSL